MLVPNIAIAILEIVGRTSHAGAWHRFAIRAWKRKARH